MIKKLKIFLFFLLILFNFSYAVDKEKAVVELEKIRKNPAHMRIGITKLSSIELALDYNENKKEIYADVDIPQGHTLYITETLAEMPSISTRNGRQVINKMKHEIHKSIKTSEKFKWELKDIENKKEKHLVVYCDTPLNSLYAYIVENGTYKIKKIYKGSIYKYRSARVKGTYGILLVTQSKGFPSFDFYEKNGKLEAAKGNKSNLTQGIKLYGHLPEIFLGKAHGVTKLEIESNQNTYNFKSGGNYNDNTGSFITGSGLSWWTDIKGNKDNVIGVVSFFNDRNKYNADSITVAYQAGRAINNSIEFNWGASDSYYEKVHFKYMTYSGEIIKEDVLEIVVQRETDRHTPELFLNNPLVYYNRELSSHGRHTRVTKLAKNEIVTLDSSNSGPFVKNTDLNGRSWLTGVGIPDYNWQNMGEHQINVMRGNDVLVSTKKTDSNGGISTPIVITGNKVGTVSNSKNEITLAYKGGDKYIYFGLSKYNFEEETIDKFTVTHYTNRKTEKAIKEMSTYTIKIPKFNGIDYVGSYDIRANQTYIKDYFYDLSKSKDEKITIDYGRVGFRNIDTHITNQSGGEGIDFRVTKKVKLINVLNPKHVIHGAKLYFEKTKESATDDEDKTSRFKGENEEQSFAMLKLDIPVQELLINQGKYKIESDDDIDNGGSPLRVGVTVNGDRKKYYTQVNGGLDKGLYLNIVKKHFIETIIEFENQTLKNNWIKLNKSEAPLGVLDTQKTTIWGRVRGDVIDIPVSKSDGSSRNLKMEIFDKNNHILLENINENNKEYKHQLSSTTSNFIIKRENTNDNFMKFTLTDGYSEAEIGKEFEFYIRYYQTEKGKDKFLFDHRYVIRFKKPTNYLGDTTLIIKNPMVATLYNYGNLEGVTDPINTFGWLNVSKNETVGNGNHNTKYDKISWWSVRNPISKYPELVNSNGIKVYRLLKNGTRKEVTLLVGDGGFREKSIAIKNGELLFGLPQTKEGYKNLFGKSVFDLYSGFEESFELEYSDGKKYRLNVVLERIDLLYYGKVFKGKKDANYSTYEMINAVGDTAKIDLSKNNMAKDGNFYIDLNTSYRDYKRYGDPIRKFLKEKMYLNIGGEVSAMYNKDYNSVIKGEILLISKYDLVAKNLSDKKDRGLIVMNNEYTNGELIPDIYSEPESYRIYLKLTPEEYRKIQPGRKYDIFYKNTHNIFTLTLGAKKDQLRLDKPLSFMADRPSLKIDTRNVILDFGSIRPKSENNRNSDTGKYITTDNGKYISRLRRLNKPIKVTLSNMSLDPNLGVTHAKHKLILESDNINLKKQGLEQAPSETEKLYVRDLVVTRINSQTREPLEKNEIKPNNSELEEYYDIEGYVDIPKGENTKIPSSGNYSGEIRVHYIFY